MRTTGSSELATSLLVDDRIDCNDPRVVAMVFVVVDVSMKMRVEMDELYRQNQKP
jgi:hypothetical protein